MKEYEYVHLKIGHFFGARMDEHRQIINEYAAKRYTYAGYLPTLISDYGKIKELDLIFEKER